MLPLFRLTSKRSNARVEKYKTARTIAISRVVLYIYTLHKCNEGSVPLDDWVLNNSIAYKLIKLDRNLNEIAN